MADRIQIITHKGHRILSVDNSNLKSAEIVANFPTITKMSIDNKLLLTYMDVSNTTTDDAIKQAGGESHAKVQAALGQTYTGIVGIRGIQKILANAMAKGQCFATSREEALDWLVEQVAK